MIRLSVEASADLQDISDRIKDNNGASVASRVTEAIFEGIRQLEQFPQLGHPGRVRNTRELGIARLPFIVVYQPLPDVIAIYRVIHGAMQWPPQSETGLLVLK